MSCPESRGSSPTSWKRWLWGDGRVDIGVCESILQFLYSRFPGGFSGCFGHYVLRKKMVLEEVIITTTMGFTTITPSWSGRNLRYIYSSYWQYMSQIISIYIHCWRRKWTSSFLKALGPVPCLTPHIHNDALHEAIPLQWHVDDLALQHSNCPWKRGPSVPGSVLWSRGRRRRSK